MATVLHLQIDQGTSFSKEITAYQPDGSTVLDLTGYTINSQIRKSEHSKNPIIDFSSVIHDATTGKLRINLTSEQTRSIKPGRYKYDVEIKSPGTESTVLSATITAGGSGYTSATAVFTLGGGIIQATGSVVLSGSTIESITIDTAGSGYVSDPIITISGDGTGATATSNRGGQVSRVVEGIITVNPEITKI